MADHPYTNRELDTKFTDIKESLDRIEAQTTKTNGRVGRLEAYRWFVTGALTFIGVVLIPTFIALIQLWVALHR